MTTHHVPQQRQLGRSRFPWEWPMLIILLLLIGIVTVLLIQQLRDRYSTSPLPTPMVAATVPAVITEPQIQLSPASGAKGTQISVRVRLRFISGMSALVTSLWCHAESSIANEFGF